MIPIVAIRTDAFQCKQIDPTSKTRRNAPQKTQAMDFVQVCSQACAHLLMDGKPDIVLSLVFVPFTHLQIVAMRRVFPMIPSSTASISRFPPPTIHGL